MATPNDGQAFGKHAGRARVPTPRESHVVDKSIEDVLRNFPAPYKIRNYYIPSEVAVHNTGDDCWISMFNQVFDLTKLIQENSASSLTDPIVLAAGTDITHWFNP
jgi:cytochrome b involved in lipid metabolism